MQPRFERAETVERGAQLRRRALLHAQETPSARSQHDAIVLSRHVEPHAVEGPRTLAETDDDAALESLADTLDDEIRPTQLGDHRTLGEEALELGEAPVHAFEAFVDRHEHPHEEHGLEREDRSFHANDCGTAAAARPCRRAPARQTLRAKRKRAGVSPVQRTNARWNAATSE
jgi:hypothetical protein